MQNNLTFNDMRAAIAYQLEQIKGSSKPEVIAAAKTVCMLTQSFVNISKAEIDYAKATVVKLGQTIDITPVATPAVEPSAHKRIELAPGVTQYQARG